MHTSRNTPNQGLWTARYVTWLASDTAFDLSSALAGFAVPLLALMVTGDPIRAGVIGAVGIAVRVVTSLIGGVLADRHSRVRLMLLGALIGIVLTLVFTWATVGWLSFASLLVINALLAARNGLFGGADQAALKDLVPGEVLGRAQAANQGRDAVLGLAGSPVGGLLLGLGAPVLGGALLLCQTVAALTSWRLQRWAPRRVEPVAQRRFLAEMREGFRFVFSRPDLRGALLVTTLVNLGFNSAVSTVVYAMQQSGRGPAVIGLVSGGLGVGMLVGAVLAPFLVTRVPAGRLTVAGLVLLAGATAALPMITHPFGIAVTMAVSILGAPALNAGLLGYFMVATPPELVGRANGALTVFAMGAMPAAPLIAGLGLGLVGRSWTLGFAALICLVAAVLALGTKSLRRLPAEAGWVAHAATHGTAVSELSAQDA